MVSRLPLVTQWLLLCHRTQSLSSRRWEHSRKRQRGPVFPGCQSPGRYLPTLISSSHTAFKRNRLLENKTFYRCRTGNQHSPEASQISCRASGRQNSSGSSSVTARRGAGQQGAAERRPLSPRPPPRPPRCPAQRSSFLREAASGSRGPPQSGRAEKRPEPTRRPATRRKPWRPRPPPHKLALRRGLRSD